ncbi:MAG: ACT domain-containing protein, partial [Actinomycetota bacterium]|nr:ACT domain-containing protein [Actinomycetota bacterium]
MGGIEIRMTEHVAVTVIGRDRPGIAAAVTRVLLESGCNLEDVTSTILRGHFSMTMIVQSASTGAELQQALAAVATDLGLVTSVKPVEDAATGVVGPTHMVSVYGSDRPGIVFAVADVLAKNEANITDLTSRVIGTEDQRVYALMLEVMLPDAQTVERELASLRASLEVDVSVHPIE